MHSKEKHQQNKKQPNEWERIFADHMTVKRLLSKIHKQLIQLSCKSNNPLKNRRKTWVYSFPKKTYTSRNLKRCSLHFPCGSAGKESVCNAGDLGSIPGLGRSPGEGKGYPLQYSGLENFMNCIVHGVVKSQTLIIREMQIKITMRYHFTFTRMAVIKNPTNNKYWRRCGKKGTLVNCWWEGNLM